MNIDKNKVIEIFKIWLSENIENYLPCHGSWEKSIEIREDLIECHWDIPRGERLENHSRVIPLIEETAREFKGYTIDVPVSLIRR